MALKDARGQLHSPKLAELVVCVGGCDSLVGGRVPAGAVGVVACHGGEKDTPLAVRWDSAPRSVIAAAAALCGDAGASDDAAQSAARVLASKIASSQNELARPGDADAPAPIDALSRRASIGGPGAAVAARAFVEALANGSRDASRCFLGPAGPFSRGASECVRKVDIDGASALANALAAAATSSVDAAPCCAASADSSRAARDVVGALVALSSKVADASTKDDAALEPLAECAQALAKVASEGGEARAALLDDARTPQLLATMLALPLRRAPGGTSTTRAAAFADHGDAVGRTAPLRALALASLKAAGEFATVPATLAALAAAYVRHGGAIGGAACATISRALERADDAWWWRSGPPVLGERLREPATAINALKMVRAVVKWRPDAAAALLPVDCGEACVEASKHSQKGAIELYVACAEAAHDSGKRIMEKLGGDAAFVDGVLASDASIAWRARAALAQTSDKVASAPPPSLDRAFRCDLRVADVVRGRARAARRADRRNPALRRRRAAPRGPRGLRRAGRDASTKGRGTGQRRVDGRRGLCGCGGARRCFIEARGDLC